MNSLELLQEFPKAAKVIKAWFVSKMMLSLNANVDEEIREYARQNGIDDDKLSKIINSNPRMLLDVFDEHGIYIEILVDLKIKPSVTFKYAFNNNQESEDFTDRISCEREAIKNAFIILNNKL